MGLGETQGGEGLFAGQDHMPGPRAGTPGTSLLILTATQGAHGPNSSAKSQRHTVKEIVQPLLCTFNTSSEIIFPTAQ